MQVQKYRENVQIRPRLTKPPVPPPYIRLPNALALRSCHLSGWLCLGTWPRFIPVHTLAPGLHLFRVCGVMVGLAEVCNLWVVY